jgi:hypothetical protein
MYLFPINGWEEFNQGDEVMALITNTLVLAEDGGIWDYYSFSETSSLWCSSETSGTNQLQLVFDTDKKNSNIKSLMFEFTNNGGLHFKQLFKLKKQLKTQFNIHVI